MFRWFQLLFFTIVRNRRPRGRKSKYCGPALQGPRLRGRNQISGYSYDAVGDVTSDGTNTYQWDGEGRLSQLGGTMTYNALGQRVYWTAGPVSYLRDVGGQTMGGNWGSGSNAFIFYGPRQLADIEGDGVYLDHPNALGSTGQATNWAEAAAARCCFTLGGSERGPALQGPRLWGRTMGIGPEDIVT